MRLILRKEQFFCLRNWGLCRDSLQIRLTVSYAGSVPDTVQLLDLEDGSRVPEGMMILLHPEVDTAGLLCIALDPACQNRTVTQFALHFESTGRPLAGLHLEYAAADALTAYNYRNIPWESSPLTQPDLLFRVNGAQMTAEPVVSGSARASCPAYSPEAADIEGDIRADLRILHCSSGTEAARIAAALEDLLTRLPLLEPPAAAQELEMQEQILTRLIDRTEAEIHRYRDRT